MAEKSVRFGINFLPGPPGELIEWVRRAEASGFELIGVADSPSVYREVFVGATLCALNTSRVRFGPRVINPLTRHPTVAASAAASLEELAPGRTLLGVGTGFSATSTAGLRSASLETLRDYMTALRDLLTTGEATYQGRPCQLTWWRGPVPLYVAAAGPKTLRLAGQVADGVIVANGLTPEVVRFSIEQVRQGAIEAGRDPDGVDLWWFPIACPAASVEAARQALAPSLAASGSQLARYASPGKHIPPELAPRLQQLLSSYRYDQHVKPGSENARLVAELGLLDYLADRYAFTGPPADCIRQVERAAEAGARQFWISVHYPDKLGFIDAWSSEVMAAFR
jgi:5,10-methylenetetrahydromethanopterin reductase